MGTRVTVTGTGTPQMTADRAGPGVLVRCGDIQMQFDAGRSTVSRLVALGSGPEQLDVVFLTHYHSDHLLGLQDLVLSRWVLDRDDAARELEIVAPNGPTQIFCERMLDVWQEDLAVRSGHNGREPVPRIRVVGFDTPTAPTPVWGSREVTVLAGPVRHEPVVGAVGYRIETADGVVAISGDTIVCDEVAAIAKDANIVVYEAMRMDQVESRPAHLRYIMDYHADTKLIGRQMAELEVSVLMLTHLIPAPNSAEDKQAFISDIRDGGFSGEVVVCDDLTSRELPLRAAR